MRYQHTVAYWIKGLTSHTREQDAAVVVDASNELRALLTTRLDTYCVEADRSIAVANMMLSGLLGRPIEGGFNQHVEAEIAQIREARGKEFGTGLFLVVEVSGAVEEFVPRRERELEDFVVCFDGAPKEPIRAASADRIRALLNALFLSADDVLGIKKAIDSVVFFREDGKPVYSYSPSFGASVYVSRAVSEEVIKEINNWYRKFLKDHILERVTWLLVSSLETEEDKLRSFLAAWSALEIFVNKTFSLYERLLFEELNKGDYPTVRQQYLDRIREVMKDKYRLSDKFAVISYLLMPKDADEDARLFIQAKKVRDDLSHGQDISETALPVESVQSLVRKYLRLHIDRSV